jgi:hypothetical protein
MRDNKHPRLGREEAKDLQKTLGGKDQARLSDYLDNVREIERASRKPRRARRPARPSPMRRSASPTLRRACG